MSDDEIGLDGQTRLVGRARELEAIATALAAARRGAARVVHLVGEAGSARRRWPSRRRRWPPGRAGRWCGAGRGALRRHRPTGSGSGSWDRWLAHRRGDPGSSRDRGLAGRPGPRACRVQLTCRPCRRWTRATPGRPAPRGCPRCGDGGCRSAAAGGLGRCARCRPGVAGVGHLGLPQPAGQAAAGADDPAASRVGSDGNHAALGELDRQGTSVLVGPLDQAAVAAQVALLSGAQPAAKAVGWLYRASGGNPFFVEQLVRWSATGEGPRYRVSCQSARRCVGWWASGWPALVMTPGGW